MHEPMFDLVSAIIGLLLGMIIMLLLVWIAYYTRTFVFTYCPITSRPCGSADYYNNPQDALEDKIGLTAGNILWVQDGKLFYNKVVKNTDCTPGKDKLTHILYPQYCEFTTTDGTIVRYKDSHFKANLYHPEVYDTGPIVTTSGNCDPIPGIFVSGTPLPIWDGTTSIPVLTPPPPPIQIIN